MSQLCNSRSLYIVFYLHLHHHPLLPQRDDISIKQCMARICVPQEHMYNLEFIQQLLRKKMVEEWQKNSENYQGYITQDLSIIAQQYLQPGHFTGDAGDLMVLTLANILGTPITLFTSLQNMPVICVMPSVGMNTTSTEPVLLAFTQSGPGHYDAVTPSVATTSRTEHETIKCNCGRKPNFKGSACSSTRCKCYRMNMSCSNLCRCKSCSNELGKRPPVSGKRKRKCYEEQTVQPLQGRITEEFMSSNSEPVNRGKITLLENLLLVTYSSYKENQAAPPPRSIFKGFNLPR